MRMTILNYYLGNYEWTLTTTAFFSKFSQTINLIIHQYKSMGQGVTSNSLQAVTLSKSQTYLMMENSILSKPHSYDWLTDHLSFHYFNKISSSSELCFNIISYAKISFRFISE